MRNEVLGNRYRILDRIGEGGMAYVYLALDEKLGRKVAIKVLHEHMERNADIRKRFQLEAEAVSRLEHPNIVKIYDFSGAQSDRLWIVTEVIRGRNLAQYAEKHPGGQIHPIISSCIVREILKALSKAHDLGIVHRDIKPENVMITIDGRVKLMDFGIAKDLGRQNVTQTGTFMGSPSYMSPEQIRGKDVDQKSDLYSLSVLFYEILTGRLPFVGQSTHDVVMRILEGSFAEPRFIIQDLPEALNDLVIKGMAPKPEHRIEDARTYGLLLDSFLTDAGFNESHIELERFFDNRPAFEERLARNRLTQTPLLAQTPEGKEVRSPASSPLGAPSPVVSRSSPSQPFGERRKRPRSLPPRRIRSSQSRSQPLKSSHIDQRRDGISLPPTPKPSTPKTSQQKSGYTPSRDQQWSVSQAFPKDQPRPHTVASSESKAKKTHPDYPKSPNPSIYSRQDQQGADLPFRGRNARPAPMDLEEQSVPHVPLPPPPHGQRRKSPRPAAKRISYAKHQGVFRIAFIKPSLLSMLIGMVIVGAIFAGIIWGFWRFSSHLTEQTQQVDVEDSSFSTNLEEENQPTKNQKTKKSKNSTITSKNIEKNPGKKSSPTPNSNLKALKNERSKPTKIHEKKEASLHQKNFIAQKKTATGPDPSGADSSGEALLKTLNKSSEDESRSDVRNSRGFKEQTKNAGMFNSDLKTGSNDLATKPVPSTKQTTQSVVKKSEKSEKLKKTDLSLARKPDEPSSQEKNRIARFKVRSHPAAEIYLDGQRVGTTVDATTESNWLTATPGRHQLEFKRKGYVTHKMPIDLAADENLNIPLIELSLASKENAPGEGKVSLTLDVSALPSQVSIRSLDSNTTQVFSLKSKTRILELPTGRYSIRVEHKGMRIEREINLSGEQEELTFSADF